MSVVKREPCLVCGSQDNLITHDNGSVWCYTPDCAQNKDRNKYCESSSVLSNLNTEAKSKSVSRLVEGTYSAIPIRRISQKTCEFFNYTMGVEPNDYLAIKMGTNGHSCQYANYNGAQKVRSKDKKLYWRGSVENVTLFGKQKWNNSSNSIIITEGEIDALSIGEAQDCKWPVVSLPNGASSARKALRSELDWLLGFKTIILCFDSDEAGKAATESCVDLFPAGKLKIASLSGKDASEVLCKGGFEELNRIVFTAQEYRPDGIVKLCDMDRKKLFQPKPRGYSIPFPLWDDATRGAPPGRITTFYAKTGIGKTTTFKEIMLHQTKKYPELKVAGIFLEESLNTTTEYLLAMSNNIISWKVNENPSLLTEEQQIKAFDNLKNVELYDHFGSQDPERLLNIIDYWAANGVKIVYLDHITMVFSGLKSGREGERKEIDNFVTSLRSLVERTQIHLFTATQLKRRDRDKDGEGNEILSEDDARGCVDSETEFLTPFGWKKIKDYDACDRIGIYQKENESIQFEIPKKYIKKPVDKFYHLKSIRGIDQVISPEHRLVFQWGNKGRNKNLQESLASDYYSKHIKSTWGHRGRFRTTFNTCVEEIIDKQTELEIRLALAYQADGTLSNRKLCHVFKFKKERKYNRLKNLLIQANIYFKDYGKFNCGQFCIETLLPIADKDLNYGFNISKQLANIVIDEIKYWDGELTTGRYFSTNKLNINFIQYCYALCGIRSVIGKRKAKNKNQKDVYRVSPSKNNTVCLANKDKKIEINDFLEHNGFKYCFVTSSSYWVARRNGKIFITGNSGSIEQISDFIIFLNRNKRGERPNEIDVEINKNRYTGIEGKVDVLEWNGETGRLLPKKIDKEDMY